MLTVLCLLLAKLYIRVFCSEENSIKINNFSLKLLALKFELIKMLWSCKVLLLLQIRTPDVNSFAQLESMRYHMNDGSESNSHFELDGFKGS